jgi:replicative DNA helicase
MLSAVAIVEAKEIVTSADFYNPANGLIFGAIADLDERGAPVDPVTVADALRRMGLLDRAGGPAKLNALQVVTPVMDHVAAYAGIVAETARKRRLAAAGSEIRGAALAPGTRSDSVLEDAEQLLSAAAGPTSQRGGPLPASVVADEALVRAEAIAERGGGLYGLATGLRDVDAILSGLEAGSLAVVAGRPSMGKTACGLGIALHNAAVGVPTLLFSAEMSSVELGPRMLAMRAAVSSDTQKGGRLTDEQWERLRVARAELACLPMHVDDRAAPSLAQVRTTARAVCARGNLGLIVVDYLQLMTGRKDAESREVAVAELAYGLKALGRELGCVVLALAQLNRQCEQRIDKRPLLSDLRESGAVEQAADIVVFIYRDEVYNPDSADRGVAELIVAKHRNGPTGAARLAWLPTLARFVDLASDRQRR